MAQMSAGARRLSSRGETMTSAPRRATSAVMTDADRSTAQTASFGDREVPRTEKAGLVRGVFDSVAGQYDVMNDVMSLGVHRVWKDLTIVRANPQPGEHLVDVAGGTGDLAAAWLKRGAATALRRGGAAPTALVVDINEAMVRAGLCRDRGRRPADGRGVRLGRMDRAVGDAERLPLTDASADCVTIAFGIRNVTDRAAALSEMRRVLKPGGRFLCLEFSRPTHGAWDAVYRTWSDHVIPRLGAAIARDEASYRYLVESIRRFPHQKAFAGELERAGFRRVSVTNFSGGVAALHMGWR